MGPHTLDGGLAEKVCLSMDLRWWPGGEGVSVDGPWSGSCEQRRLILSNDPRATTTGENHRSYGKKQQGHRNDAPLGHGGDGVTL